MVLPASGTCTKFIQHMPVGTKAPPPSHVMWGSEELLIVFPYGPFVKTYKNPKTLFSLFRPLDYANASLEYTNSGDFKAKTEHIDISEDFNKKT